MWFYMKYSKKLHWANTFCTTVIKSLEDASLISWFSVNKMQANPEKIQAMAIGDDTHKHNITLNLNGCYISCDDEVKLLGVTIDFKLNFNTHIANICKKAAHQLNVLKRIGQHLNKLAKMTIYHSFIMSNLSYCPLTWHFCSERNSKHQQNRKTAGKSITFHLRQHQLIWHTAWTIKTTITKNQTNENHGIIETYEIVNQSSPKFLHTCNLITLKDNL